MIERIATVATTVAAIGCGLTAGVMLAFSVAVMPALRVRPASDGGATMKQINVSIVSPTFLSVFLGSAVAAGIAATSALVSGSDTRVWVTAGALLYIGGCVLVTVAVNVPLNDALAAVDPGSTAGAEVWSNYMTQWTRWNHARTAAAGAACVLLTLATRL
ncbi:DUF1772 domain-containing protein [Rhodococcus sovatensis]|uniref:Anthrone oxygenase family protein n=1 Tax=Rhodococcus sovatensis TaxID=1805840 RepID=A0ABZ2PQX1_9NOCA